MDLKTLLFPHDTIRPVQEEFIKTVLSALEQRKNCVIHAPTGLGKTAASLAPTLSFTRDKKLTIFFLTSRHTQHTIVLDTLAAIKTKYNLNILATSIIGKKSMCLQPNVDLMKQHDFTQYCKYLREQNQCEYYTRARSKPAPLADVAVATIIRQSPLPAETVKQHCDQERLCPYEISLILAEKSDVIIADYHYLFNPAIRQAFFTKIHKELENAIIIIDEGHNLPSRLREILTTKISNFTLKRAIKEAKTVHNEELAEKISLLYDIHTLYAKNLANTAQIKLDKQTFITAVNKISQYDLLVEELEIAAELVKDNQHQSSISVLVEFLKIWKSPDHGYCRILKREDPLITLSFKCLDPSLASKDVITAAYATILMSGTLLPTTMYKDLLGFPPNTIEKEFTSPFPKHNKLAIIVPKTTTKYSARNEQQYKAIATICAEIINEIPGSCAVFFPSYHLRDSIHNHLCETCEKTMLLEQQNHTKEQKQNLLNELKHQDLRGKVLLGTAAGSFGEGIDLPGILKAVIVVGLPLDRPTLETQELINYYDATFGKGWDYGYILPALTKCLQNAGRCIRSEHDRGVIIFLDERYTHPHYFKCFPPDWNLKISLNYAELIKDFFQQKF